MKNYLIIATLLSVILLSCGKEPIPVAPCYNIDRLVNSWSNSFEEENQNPKIKIYRNSNHHTLLPSRFREIIEFFADGQCRFLTLAPNDGHYYIEGKWSYSDKEMNIIQITDSSGFIHKRFLILELKPDVLKLQMLN